MAGVQLELFRPRSIAFGFADDLAAIGSDVAVVGVVAVAVVIVAVVVEAVVVVVVAENGYQEDKHPSVQKMDFCLVFAEVLHALFQWPVRIELE